MRALLNLFYSPPNFLIYTFPFSTETICLVTPSDVTQSLKVLINVVKFEGSSETMSVLHVI